MRILMIFFIKMFEYTLGAIFWSIFRKNSSKKKSYNRGRYDRNRSLSINQINVIEFSFGKYKGQSVKKIWKSNRGYIDWLRENIDLTKYPNEEFAIEELLNAEV